MTPTRIAALAIAVATCAGAAAFARLAIANSRTYVFVDDVVASPRFGRDMQVHGWVEPGSIVKTGERVSFVLQKDGKRLRVIAALADAHCIRDQSETIIEGQLATGDDMREVAGELGVPADDLVFDGTSAKCCCPGKYDGARPAGQWGVPQPPPLSTKFE